MADETAARVVVVDDNPATLYSTSHILRAAGFNVTEGTTGEQALELAQQGADILLLDVNLPDIHGFEVCRRLTRRIRELRGCPSSTSRPLSSRRSTRREGLDAGGDGYLTHPVEPPVLIATVNAFLRTRRAEDEMRKSEAKFKAVFDNASSGILLLDQQFDLSRGQSGDVRSAGSDRVRRLWASRCTAFMPAGNFGGS